MHVKTIRWTVPLALVVLSVFLVACGAGRPACDAEATIDTAEIRQRGYEYYVMVSGYHPDACSETGRITQTVVGQTIKVSVCTSRPEDKMCAQMLTPFQETIPLNVGGLSPGQYTVDVNGTVTILTLAEGQ
jgi:hypothetical protein